MCQFLHKSDYLVAQKLGHRGKLGHFYAKYRNSYCFRDTMPRVCNHISATALSARSDAKNRQHGNKLLSSWNWYGPKRNVSKFIILKIPVQRIPAIFSRVAGVEGGLLEIYLENVGIIWRQVVAKRTAFTRDWRYFSLRKGEIMYHAWYL